MYSPRDIPAPLSLTGARSPTAAGVGPSPLTWNPALAGARSVHGRPRRYGAPPGLGPRTPALSLSRRIRPAVMDHRLAPVLHSQHPAPSRPSKLSTACPTLA